MASVTFDKTTCLFPGATTPAVDKLDLHIEDGEFLVLVGPSGCGKSTSLRMLAGLEEVYDGRILIGDAVVSTPEHQVPPEERRIGIVFQSYALWPHMTVAENVAYGLTVAGVRDPERTKRVDAALSLVELEGFAEAAFVDGVGEFLHERRRNGDRHAQVHRQEHDQRHQANGDEEQ